MSEPVNLNVTTLCGKKPAAKILFDKTSDIVCASNVEKSPLYEEKAARYTGCPTEVKQLTVYALQLWDT